MGRPPKYKTPEEMQPVIDSYFLKCEEGKTIKWISKRGEAVDAKMTQPPSWTGLALHLGFRSYQSLNDYIKRKKEGNEDETEESFAFILTRAKSQIADTLMSGATLGLWDWRPIQTNLAANHGVLVPKQEVAVKGDLSLKVVDQFKDGKKPAG